MTYVRSACERVQIMLYMCALGCSAWCVSAYSNVFMHLFLSARMYQVHDSH